MKKLELTQRIIDTDFGEIMLKGGTDYANDSYCDMYIGDNYDHYVGSIDCSIYDSEVRLNDEVNSVLGD